MKQGERIAAFSALAGSGAIAAYLLYQVAEGNVSSLSDAWGVIQSIGVRAYLIARGTIPMNDAKSIAAKLIATEEGFRSHAYPDPPGQTSKYSIGYGHQIRPGDGLDINSVVDQPTAFGMLLSDLDLAANCVDNAVQVDITANERAALYSFTYNEGCHAFETSTMLRDINNGDLGEASGEFDRWVYANGQISAALQQRRNDEQALFSSDGFSS